MLSITPVFLQILMAKRKMLLSEAQRILADCQTILKCETQSLTTVVGEINKYLDPMHLSIVTTNDQSGGGSTLFLINTRADELTQGATELNKTELAYFRKLIDLVVTADSWQYAWPQIQALNSASKIGTDENPLRLTATQAQHVLNVLLENDWLAKTSRGYIKLTTRAVLELAPYLSDTYMDIYPCAICAHLVTEGVRCPLDRDEQSAWKRLHPETVDPDDPEAEANVLMHHHCSAAHFAISDSLPGFNTRYDQGLIVEVGTRDVVPLGRVETPVHTDTTRKRPFTVEPSNHANGTNGTSHASTNGTASSARATQKSTRVKSTQSQQTQTQVAQTTYQKKQKAPVKKEPSSDSDNIDDIRPAQSQKRGRKLDDDMT